MERSRHHRPGEALDDIVAERGRLVDQLAIAASTVRLLIVRLWRLDRRLDELAVHVGERDDDR